MLILPAPPCISQFFVTFNCFISDEPAPNSKTNVSEFKLSISTLPAPVFIVTFSNCKFCGKYTIYLLKTNYVFFLLFVIFYFLY